MESLKLFMTNTKAVLGNLTGRTNWYDPPLITLPQVATQICAITGEAEPTTLPITSLEEANRRILLLEGTLSALIEVLIANSVLPGGWSPPPV